MIVSGKQRKDSTIQIHGSILSQTSSHPGCYIIWAEFHGYTAGPCWFSILKKAVYTCLPKLPNYPFPYLCPQQLLNQRRIRIFYKVLTNILRSLVIFFSLCSCLVHKVKQAITLRSLDCRSCLLLLLEKLSSQSFF